MNDFDKVFQTAKNDNDFLYLLGLALVFVGTRFVYRLMEHDCEGDLNDDK